MLDWGAARGLDGAGCAQTRVVLVRRRFVSGREFGAFAGEGEDQKIAILVGTKPGVGTQHKRLAGLVPPNSEVVRSNTMGTWKVR